MALSIRTKGWLVAGAVCCLAAAATVVPEKLVDVPTPYVIRVKKALKSESILKDGIYLRDGFPMANAIETAQLVSEAAEKHFPYCVLTFRPRSEMPHRPGENTEGFAIDRITPGMELRITRIATEGLAEAHWATFVIEDPKNPIQSLYCDGLSNGANTTMDEIREIVGRDNFELPPIEKQAPPKQPHKQK